MTYIGRFHYATALARVYNILLVFVTATGRLHQQGSRLDNQDGLQTTAFLQTTSTPPTGTYAAPVQVSVRGTTCHILQIYQVPKRNLPCPRVYPSTNQINWPQMMLQHPTNVADPVWKTVTNAPVCYWTRLEPDFTIHGCVHQSSFKTFMVSLTYENTAQFDQGQR